jgi:nitrite reductase/ring-hydroxylating ferredoxin subunit
MSRLVKLATLDQLPPGSAREFELDGRIIALFHANGRILAIDGICAHQGGPLAEGEVQNCRVSCPWHGWTFDLLSGQNTTNPRIRQQTFEIEIQDQDVLVRLN